MLWLEKCSHKSLGIIHNSVTDRTHCSLSISHVILSTSRVKLVRMCEVPIR